MNHIVLGPNLIVQQEEAASQTVGGIFIPQGSAAKPLIGTVIRVGQIKQPLKVGQTIMFDRFAGQAVKLDGKEYLVMHEEDVLIILKESKDA